GWRSPGAPRAIGGRSSGSKRRHRGRERPRSAPGSRPAMHRDFHLPGRSPVIASEGMAATSHPLASLAAIAALRAGGNAAVAARVAFDWSSLVERLRRDAGAARHFLVQGRAPEAGEVLRFPALAETLKAIAANGPAAFYQGRIAQDLVATVAARGGVLAMED